MGREKAEATQRFIRGYGHGSSLLCSPKHQNARQTRILTDGQTDAVIGRALHTLADSSADSSESSLVAHCSGNVAGSCNLTHQWGFVAGLRATPRGDRRQWLQQPSRATEGSGSGRVPVVRFVATGIDSIRALVLGRRLWAGRRPVSLRGWTRPIVARPAPPDSLKRGGAVARRLHNTAVHGRSQVQLFLLAFEVVSLQCPATPPGWRNGRRF